MKHSSGALRTIWGERRLKNVNSFKICFSCITVKILTIPDRSFSDVTDSSGFYDIPDYEFLDSLVLWDTTSAIGTTHSLDMATVVLVTSSVTAFLGLKFNNSSIIYIFLRVAL